MKRLEWQKPYQTTFTTRIKEQVPRDKGYAYILEETYFYPEGGGQPADSGHLNEARVLDVQLIEGQVVHFTDQPLSNPVVGQLDWERRFDHMQQHTGQHLLSGAFDHYGAATVGFHLSDSYATIDIDRTFDQEELKAIEELANVQIWKDHAISFHYPAPDEVDSFPLRKAPKVKEGIRIMEIPGFDFSPCGGTHVSSTGQVGLVKIRKTSPHKGGLRITFHCGKRALHILQTDQDQLSLMAQELSAPLEELAKAFSQYQAQHQDLLEREASLRLAQQNLYLSIMNKEAETLQDYVLYSEQVPFDSKDTRLLAAKFAADEKKIALLASQDNKLFFAAHEGVPFSMKELLQEAFSITGGKGGGNEKSAQGAVTSPEMIPKALMHCKDYLLRSA